MEKVKSLEQVGQEINENIGEFKDISPKNGYYLATFRR